MSQPAEKLTPVNEATGPKVRDVLPGMEGHHLLAELMDVEVPAALKPVVDPKAYAHRKFRDDEFWRQIPGYADVDRATFLDWKFQNKQSVTSVDKLVATLGNLASPAFIDDVRAGIVRAPMNVRLSPYTVALIDWANPYQDPLRIQFLPVGSTQLPDHPKLTLDSLHEQADAPTPGLTHRYHDKALFLPLDVCPVYCRFCTRSYAIGGDTDTVHKARLKPETKRWHKDIAYIASRPEIEDIVVSGGDLYMLPAQHVGTIGHLLLAIPHIRRIRIATKGPAVSPMKILTDEEWTTALFEIANAGRAMGKEVCLHTHFNTPNEITEITRQAMEVLFKGGVTVRNQTVLIRNVNDSVATMTELVRRLSYMNVRPYYVYQHDMVSAVEELRTTVQSNINIERGVRGSTAGFNTPLSIVDLPGGGGKRDIHSFEHYDRTTGISVYRSPAVHADLVYLYFDPVDLLPPEGRERWARPAEHRRMIDEAIGAAGLTGMPLAVV
jgi:lysine 2,3-aminomutase